MKPILKSEYTFEKTFNLSDVKVFSKLSEDDNPIHIDPEYASTTMFERNIVHGVLLVSMFSKIFGTIYPSNGAIYLSQTAKFIKPAFVGDKILAKIVLVSFDELKNRGKFTCECHNHKGELLVSGEAKILFPQL